jgi:hypothetical protein
MMKQVPSYQTMKKRLVLLSTIILIAVPINTYSQKSDQSSITDKVKYGLIGPVELFQLERATFSNNPDSLGKYVELKREYLATYTFDLNGKLIHSDPPRYAYSTMIGERVPTYDNKGNLVEEIVHDIEGLFSYKSTFKYDKDGNQIESEYYGSKGLMWVRKYDIRGREIEVAKYDEAGRIEYRELKVFQEEENNVESLTYDRDGLLTKRERTSIETDQNGNWIKLVWLECNAENDKLPCKPVESWYRLIRYY